MRGIVPLAVNLRAAVQTEAVLRRGVQVRGHAAGLRGHLYDLPAVAAVAADLHAVVLRAGSRAPAESQAFLTDIRHRCVHDARGQDLVLSGHGAVVIAHTADRHGAETDLGVVGIRNVAVDVRIAGLDRQLLTLIGGGDGAQRVLAIVDGVARFDHGLGDILAHEAALRADMVFIPVMAFVPEGRTAIGCVAGLAGRQVVAGGRAGTGIDRLGLVCDAVIAEVIHLLADLLPAGDIVASQEVHLLLGALDGHPAGVLRVLDVDHLAADRAGGLAILIGRQLVASRAAGL